MAVYLSLAVGCHRYGEKGMGLSHSALRLFPPWDVGAVLPHCTGIDVLAFTVCMLRTGINFLAFNR
jgi:hypothetical protein